MSYGWGGGGGGGGGKQILNGIFIANKALDTRLKSTRGKVLCNDTFIALVPRRSQKKTLDLFD